MTEMDQVVASSVWQELIRTPLKARFAQIAPMERTHLLQELAFARSVPRVNMASKRGHLHAQAVMQGHTALLLRRQSA